MAAPRDLFAANGTWLRCALHAHTTRSDGELEPEDLVALYERAGFDVLAITDHWVRTEAPSTDAVLVIPSSELSYALSAESSGHLLALGIDADPLDFVRTRPDLAETAAWVGEHDGVAYLAHPYWTGMPVSGVSLSDGVVGIEVYNAGCDLEVGRGLSTVHWDELLERGTGCFGIATDDSHHAERDSGFAWVWTHVTERSAAAILEALVTGRFYSSTGPTLDGLRVDESSVEVNCSPCRRVTLCTGRKRGASVTSGASGYCYCGEILAESNDGEITHARLDRPPRTPYGRLEVVDGYGRKAWTNPLWD